jgi:hypothetical protein
MKTGVLGYLAVKIKNLQVNNSLGSQENPFLLWSPAVQ